MSAATTAPPRRSQHTARGGGFRPALRAEWAKFWTVRGWVTGVILVALLPAGIALLNHSSCGGQTTPGGPVIGCSAPLGPGGEAVTDSFTFTHRPLGTHGAITARMTSLTKPPGQPAGTLDPWSKAGIIIKASTRPGSAYAAMMVTTGHGVRMQDDFTTDITGLPGTVSPASPRWLRLTRAGDTLTGYESSDGSDWRRVGVARLAGLPATVQAGLFAASPGLVASSAHSQSLTGSSASGALSLVQARFDHVAATGDWPASRWAGSVVGGGPGNQAAPGAGSQRAGGTVTVTGTGDIAPDTPASPSGTGSAPEQTLLGVFAALIAAILVGALFMTAEYRRGMIRLTYAATPSRGRVLAAKAAVAGGVTFVAGLAGAIGAVCFGESLLRSNGNFVLPVSPLTEIRMLAGAAALLAVAAVLALALGAILRSGAATVTALTVTVVLPYFFTGALSVLPASAADWLMRVTPAAGFAVEQTLIRYPQVTGSYSMRNGFYPLPPWAGFAVLCGYAAAALALAAFLQRRRDA